MISVVRKVVLPLAGQSVTEPGQEVTVRIWVVRSVEVVGSPADAGEESDRLLLLVFMADCEMVGMMLFFGDEGLYDTDVDD